MPEITAESLRARVRMSEPLDARIERCKNMIADMCKTGRQPKMSIPVNWDDEDFFIVTTLEDVAKRIEDLEQHVKRLEEDLDKKNQQYVKMETAVGEALTFIKDASWVLEEDTTDD